MKRINLPNAITIFRMLLAVPISFFLIDDDYPMAVVLFIIAAVSDALDGFFARVFNKKTTLGAILDPLADKILINCTFAILATKGYVPSVLFVTVLFKDIVLVVGSAVEVLSVRKLENVRIKASVAGKLSTFFQVTVIVLVFFKLFSVYENTAVFGVAVYVTIFLSVLALFNYVYGYIKFSRGV